ncbi:hypothetical protein TIFTF001_003844 [Ficus carica]|uniref:SHSP domain-containing protein n=1 Tax=Ficus carica TaxID=3494 RepID=A0AA87ZFA5_FICCA|nr:hypothetical protein TIFTF001_003844 [Ficus carica]
MSMASSSNHPPEEAAAQPPGRLSFYLSTLSRAGPIFTDKEFEPGAELGRPVDGRSVVGDGTENQRRGPRRAWDAKEDENALNLRMDMPGLSKEDVKVTVEQNTLIVKVQASSEEEAAESGGRRYVSRLDLLPNVYKLDSIKAEMKNGVLRLVTPKVKDEERKDVYQVQVN